MVQPLGGIRIQTTVYTIYYVYVLYMCIVYSRGQKEHLYAINKQIKTSLFQKYILL